MAGAAGCVSVSTRQAPDRTVQQLVALAERLWFLIFVGINVALLVFLNSLERHFRPVTARVLAMGKEAVEKVPEEERPVRGAFSCALPELPKKDRELHRVHAIVYSFAVAMVASWTSECKQRL